MESKHFYGYNNHFFFNCNINKQALKCHVRIVVVEDLSDLIKTGLHFISNSQLLRKIRVMKELIHGRIVKSDLISK